MRSATIFVLAERSLVGLGVTGSCWPSGSKTSARPVWLSLNRKFGRGAGLGAPEGGPKRRGAQTSDNADRSRDKFLYGRSVCPEGARVAFTVRVSFTKPALSGANRADGRSAKLMPERTAGEQTFGLLRPTVAGSGGQVLQVSSKAKPWPAASCRPLGNRSKSSNPFGRLIGRV